MTYVYAMTYAQNLLDEGYSEEEVIGHIKRKYHLDDEEAEMIVDLCLPALPEGFEDDEE